MAGRFDGRRDIAAPVACDDSVDQGSCSAAENAEACVAEHGTIPERQCLVVNRGVVSRNTVAGIVGNCAVVDGSRRVENANPIAGVPGDSAAAEAKARKEAEDRAAAEAKANPSAQLAAMQKLYQQQQKLQF